MIVFPSNPTLNQVHTVGGRSWQWNGTAWQSISNAVAWVDIADKPTVFPPSTHQHSISEVTGLQVALDGKASSATAVLTTDARLSDARQPLSHQHSLADITQSGAASGQVPYWNGTAWIPGTIANAGGVLNGGGASTISVMTQAAYTALAVKDNNTIYILT